MQEYLWWEVNKQPMYLLQSKKNRNAEKPKRYFTRKINRIAQVRWYTLCCFHLPPKSPFFVSGLFYLFNVICKQHLRNAFNPHFNAKKKGDFDGKCVWTRSNGVVTLPDADTETETDTDTDKLTQNPIRICFDIFLYAVWTPPCNSIQPIFQLFRCHAVCTHHNRLKIIVVFGRRRKGPEDPHLGKIWKRRESLLCQCEVSQHRYFRQQCAHCLGMVLDTFFWSIGNSNVSQSYKPKVRTPFLKN